MLQPRILVDSHRTDQQTSKFKTNNIVATNWRCNKKTSLATKMSSKSKCFTSATAKCAAHNSDEFNTTNKRRQTAHKSAQVLSPTINISSPLSIHNLATFVILAIILYSTSVCMAQLSGEYHTLFYTIPYHTIAFSFLIFYARNDIIIIWYFFCVKNIYDGSFDLELLTLIPYYYCYYYCAVTFYGIFARLK